MKTTLQRAQAYLDKMSPAIEGSGGDWATYCAATALIRGFALSEAEALPLLLAWNKTHCQPCWTEAELRGKLRGAQSSTQPLGQLKDDPQFTDFSRACRLTNHGFSPARRRESWPRFQPLARTAIQHIAGLRGLPWPAVDLAARIGCLGGAVVDGHRCYILHEGTFAQARRLDGQPFAKADGSTLKAKNLPGSEGAFIGSRTLGGPGTRVLVVEGVIGLLEALAAHELTDPVDSWGILAATSASSRFARAPHLRDLLKGRRVRIVPDADPAGRQAASLWLGELMTVGAVVDVITLPPGCKDLGPIVSSATSSSYPTFLTTLFQ